jgi:hypothetical protein
VDGSNAVRLIMGDRKCRDPISGLFAGHNEFDLEIRRLSAGDYLFELSLLQRDTV